MHECRLTHQILPDGIPNKIENGLETRQMNSVKESNESLDSLTEFICRVSRPFSILFGMPSGKI